MLESKRNRSCGTHDGRFHADEVTACALLSFFNLIDKDKIVRTRDPSKLACCEYVCDVGGCYIPEEKLFDHHQVEYQGDFSSAGMVLNYLKKIQSITERDYDFFYESFIWGVDAIDTGKDVIVPGVFSYSQIVSQFNPILHDSSVEEQDICFNQAFDFAYNLIDRMWSRYQYTQSCREVVAKAMEKSEKYLIFEKNIPWQDLFFEMNGINHPALFVVMPADNHWKLRGIPPNLEHKMDVRMPLPKKWAGLLGEELEKISGIKGAVFCHKGRFISVWETREGVLQALKEVLEIEG